MKLKYADKRWVADREDRGYNGTDTQNRFDSQPKAEPRTNVKPREQQVNYVMV